uniref:Hematopoietic lineage cell-specific protein-like n=1 Tax=Salarias fasciatus TaxID=181472 RepID=A0A672GCN5_SALFA
MWKSVVGHNVNMKVSAEGDDWETDPDFENDVSEQEQRWGAKTIEGSGRKEHISVAELRSKVAVEHEQVKQKEHTPKASYGYGGKFGVEKDRMDKAALGHDYVGEVEQHSSQKDASKGFGGKFGVQKDRVDKSAMGFEYKGEVQQHGSQKDYSKGFGGKYGVEKDKVDKAALGYDYKGETEKHQSQKDYSKGFGGKFGVEKEKVDKAALGFDYKGETEKHQSQKDYSKGFGGKFGVEKEKVDKAALGFDYKGETEKHESQKDYSAGFGGRFGVQTDRMDKVSLQVHFCLPAIKSVHTALTLLCVRGEKASAGAGKLKARFESMAKASDEESRKKAEEERARRQARESREREEAARRQQVAGRRRGNAHETLRSFKDAVKESLVFQEQSSREEKSPPPPVPEATPEHATLKAETQQHISEFWNEGDRNLRLRRRYDASSCASETDIGFPAFQHFLPTEADDEISFNPDDIITNVEMVDEGWWKGQCHGRVGLFPAAYVQLM